MAQSKEPNAYEQQLVSLGQVLQTLREGSDIEALIGTVVSYLQRYFSHDLIWLGLYDRVDYRLVGKGGTLPPGEEVAFLKQRFALAPGDLMEQVIIQQRPIALPDLREEIRLSEWRRIARKNSIQGTMIFPISYQDRCFGVVMLGSRLWGNFPRTEEKALLSMIVGGLAAALNTVETEWKRQQVKRPEQPLITILDHLVALPNLGQRLEAVVEQTHQFIMPSRTSVYWFERQRRYFWRRVTNLKPTNRAIDDNQPASGITVQEMSSFYQALASDQIVLIGEARSSLRADTTSRLMQQIRARSLMAAPILYQNELLGFLAAEGNEARIWQEEERNYLRAAAQLIALVTPLENLESIIEQTKLDQSLTAKIAHAIYSNDDWKVTLKNTAELLGKRLKTDRFVVVMYDPDPEQFEVCYQNHPNNRRSLPNALAHLMPIDWQMLERSRGAIAIENLEDDLRLGAWRDLLLELGIRSLLVCNTSVGQPLQGLMLVCHEAPRSWGLPECDLTQVVAQQIGLILRQWQLQKQNDHQQKMYQTIQWGLAAIQQTQQLELLERSALQYIAQILQAPMAALVSWSPGRRSGRLVQSGEIDHRFTFSPVLKVSIFTDALVHRAIEHNGLLALSIDEVPVESRQWLNAPGIGQLLIMALRTAPEHEPTGMLLIADTLERRWNEGHFAALNTLVSQFAWSRRYLMLSDTLKSQREKLERLSWYKQRRLEEMYRSVKIGINRLGEVALSSKKDALLMTRQQQILRQLNDSIAPLQQVIREEQWQLQVKADTVPLVSLLRRALDRVDNLIKQRQLWSQVHNETNPILTGDIAKFELVLYELLLTACQRSHPGGRIDLWCRQLDQGWVELSITDDGAIEPRLIEDLETGRAVDLLAPSMVDKPPGLHLAICQSLMKQMGAEFNLYKLEDGRIMSRLVLPLGQ
ncbi:MAG: GAF domain-containing protein [Leptolyngbyaceae cyanobacterium CSU_1_3]|nr:GAF domain-containing protein [Leptolyngbyaceae cyanobacterium CSU_1_3]